MIYKLTRGILVVLYLMMSSIFVHAGVMSHDMLMGEIVQLQPCHEDSHTDESQDSGDCFEMCMSVYEEVGGGVCLLLKEFSDVHRTVFVYQINSGDTTLKKHFVYNEDPPPLSLIGYARVGKEIKKIE